MRNFFFLALFISCFLFFTGCGTTSSPAGGFIPDTYVNTKFTMMQGTGDNRLVQDLLVEPFIYPFVHVLNFGSLRFLWDHGDFPLSGFTHSLLDVFATLPIYSHTDIRFKKIFGLGDTNTEVLNKKEVYFTPPTVNPQN
ncbi:MAG: hypothetical protein HUU50_15505 [Candidatus Brocadiae bacterium]|nr:hypothetical protein [Candidatus Brocadiia bacterium]